MPLDVEQVDDDDELIEQIDELEQNDNDINDEIEHFLDEVELDEHDEIETENDEYESVLVLAESFNGMLDDELDDEELDDADDDEILDVMQHITDDEVEQLVEWIPIDYDVNE